MRCRKMPMAVAILLAGCWSLSPSARGAEDESRARDEQAIRAAAKQYVDALSRGDAKALAALWLPEGDIVDESGLSTPVRDVIDQEVKARQAAKPGGGTSGEVKLNDSKIRFLTADVAVEDGTVTVTAKDRPAQEGRFTAIWVRGDGHWRLATLREASLPSNAAADLAALEAMVGRWSGQGGKAKFDLTVQWNTKHTFLERKLTVTHDGKAILEGWQRIGVDPLDGKIKSWMHDSDGGRSEGVWIRHGNAWVVQGVGVAPDGRRSASTNVYTFDGPDTLNWKSSGGYSSGQKVPDFEIKLARVAGVE